MAPPLIILTNFKHKFLFSNHVPTNPFNVANVLNLMLLLLTQPKQK
jgi:hypothetical protein